jgi:hypothetical protein
MTSTRKFLYIFCIGAFFAALPVTFANDNLEVKKKVWQSSNVFEERTGRYSISNNACKITWEIIEFKNEGPDNYYNLKYISGCKGTFLRQRHLHEKVLRRILSEWDGTKFSRVHVYGLKQLEPSGIWNDRIASVSANSADWIDWRKNYPHHSSGKSINDIFVQAANACYAYKEFADLFKELGYFIKMESVEKVESTKTKPSLLYDAAFIYFSMKIFERR